MSEIEQSDLGPEVVVPVVEPAVAEPAGTSQSSVSLPAVRRPGKRTCGAVVAATGKPCPASPVTGQDRCFHHSDNPTTMALAASARRQGGAVARLQGVELTADYSSANAIRDTLERVSDAVAGGKIPSAAGNVVVQAARVAVELAQAQMEATLAALSAQVEQALKERDRR
jgi:hypothetical protein